MRYKNYISKIKVKNILSALLLILCAYIIFTHSSSNDKTITRAENPNIVYITFDADMTPTMKDELQSGQVKSWYSIGILNYLEENKIGATFFVTGMFAEVYPEVVKRIGGNKIFSIGNHTYDHKAFETPCYGLDAVYGNTEKRKEITKTQEIIRNMTGTSPKYVRLPGLCSSKHDEELIKKLELLPSNTGIISGDAFAQDPKRVVTEVLRQIKPGKNIIIMHFGGPNARVTEKALEELVPLIGKKGFALDKL